MDNRVKDILTKGIKATETTDVTVMVNDLNAALGPQADQFTEDAKPGSSITVNRVAVLKALESTVPNLPQK